MEEAEAHGLVVLNTMFKKRWEHLVMYESGGRRAQIDYIMTRMQNKRSCTNCKVLPGDWEEQQHKMVVADMVWKVTQEAKKKTNVDVVKWSKMRGKERELKEGLMRRVNWKVEGTVEDVWESVARAVRAICSEVLGVSKGGKAMVSKDIWWWDETVRSALKEKKQAFREWKTLNTEELLCKYRRARKAARRAVAMAKARK